MNISDEEESVMTTTTTTGMHKNYGKVPSYISKYKEE